MKLAKVLDGLDECNALVSYQADMFGVVGDLVWITNLVTRSKSGHRSTGLVDLPQIPLFHLDGGVLQADGLWTRGS